MVLMHQMIFTNEVQSGLIADEWVPMLNRGIDTNSDYTYASATKEQFSDQRVQLNNDGERFHVDSNGLVEFREPKDGSIKSISLLGERNSGTRWIYG